MHNDITHSFQSVAFDQTHIDPQPVGFVRPTILAGLIIGGAVWALAIWKMVDLFGWL